MSFYAVKEPDRHREWRSETRAAVLISSLTGGVLLVRRPDESTGWALPSAPVQPSETPRAAAVRAISERFGLTPRLGDPLVVDWSPAGNGTDQASVWVFDGGRISASAGRRILNRPAGTALFADVDELPARLLPAETRRAAAALRARSDDRPIYLEQADRPAAAAVMRDFGIRAGLHSGSSWRWKAGPVPDDLPIKHAWGWVFAPNGRVVLYVDADGQTGLPGGTLEDFEDRDPVAALLREIGEEVQMEVTQPVYLGYLLDEQPGRRPVARVRMAAVVTAVHPAAVDPATGTMHRRLLVPPRLVAELCGWGADGHGQAEAAIAAAHTLGIREADDDLPVAEVPADGSGVLAAI